MKSASIFFTIKRFWSAIILTSAIAVTACNPANFKTAAAQVPQVVTAVLSEPSTFNYALNESAYSVFGFLYDSLINENPLTTKLEPGLAEAWEVSEDGQRIVITLREGI